MSADDKQSCNHVSFAAPRPGYPDFEDAIKLLAEQVMPPLRRRPIESRHVGTLNDVDVLKAGLHGKSFSTLSHTGGLSMREGNRFDTSQGSTFS